MAWDTTTWELQLDLGRHHDVTGDLDGDGRQDQGYFLDGQWWFQLTAQATGVERRRSFGRRGDLPAVGDFNGDGRDDLAVYREGRWRFDLDGAGEPAELDVAPGCHDRADSAN
jgi:hypothetical protein